MIPLELEPWLSLRCVCRCVGGASPPSCSGTGPCSSRWQPHGQRLAILKKWRDFHLCRPSPGPGLSSFFPGIAVRMSPSNTRFGQTRRNGWTVCDTGTMSPGAAGPFNPFSHCLPAEGFPLRKEAQTALHICPCPSVLLARLVQGGTLITFTPFSSSLLFFSLFLPFPFLVSVASV